MLRAYAHDRFHYELPEGHRFPLGRYRMLREAIEAKYLAAEAGFFAADAAIQTHGGFGYAREYDIERKWREARVQRTAPISTNLILSYLAEHVLGLPRSY